MYPLINREANEETKIKIIDIIETKTMIAIINQGKPFKTPNIKLL